MPRRGEAPLTQALVDHQAAEEARRAEEQEVWDAFREAYPARFATQRRKRWAFGRPKIKGQQSDWSVYTAKVVNSRTKIQQQHLIVPVLMRHSQGVQPSRWRVSTPRHLCKVKGETAARSTCQTSIAWNFCWSSTRR